jgi:hypothetical protein
MADRGLGVLMPWLGNGCLVGWRPSGADRLEAVGLQLAVEGDVVCCYVRQDKHWVTGPDGQRWENYVVLADAHPELEGKSRAELPLVEANTGCCGGATSGAGGEDSASACCA